MFDNIYLDSLFIILVVFVLIISGIFVYNILIKKNKLWKSWDISVREYSVYIKYSFRTRKFSVDCYQTVDETSLLKLEEYLSTDDFYSSLMESKKSDSPSFNYSYKVSNYEIEYVFAIKDSNSSSVIIRKDEIYLKTLDDLKMEHSMSEKKHAAFFYINIKEFNTLNQRYGRIYGDYILEVLRNRLNSIHAYKCSSAYVGGAQYAVYVNKKLSKKKAIRFAKKIVKKLTKPIDEKYLMIDISIGVGVCIGEYEDFNEYVKYSYVAADYAKNRNKYNVILYTSAMKSEEILR